MDVSVVILNYNVKYHLDACIQSVQKALENIKAEIIVADNNSTDGSRDYFKDIFPTVKFLWFSDNSGFAKGYNKAVKHAKGKYLFILNPDTLIAENTIQLLLDFVKTKENIGIIGGKMIDGTGNFLPESKRGVPKPLVAFGKLTGLYKILKFAPFNQYYAPHLQENETGKAEILTGAFMFLEKSVYEEVGGFDERYFMFGEDIDLSYTILLTGRKNYYFPEAKIIHFKGESTVKDKRYVSNFLETTFQFQKKFFNSVGFLEYFLRFFFKIWMFFKTNKSKKTNATVPKTAYYFGHSEHIHSIQNLGFNDVIALKSLDKIPKNQTLIIDTSALKISLIISQMEKLKNFNIKFRFYFPKHKILLGSDSKDLLGFASKLN